MVDKLLSRLVEEILDEDTPTNTTADVGDGVLGPVVPPKRRKKDDEAEL